MCCYAVYTVAEPLTVTFNCVPNIFSFYYINFYVLFTKSLTFFCLQMVYTPSTVAQRTPYPTPKEHVDEEH